MKQRYMLGVGALAMIAILGFSFVAAGGFGMGKGFGYGMSDLTDEERAAVEAQKEAMQGAIESGDYAAWEGMMEDRLAGMEDSINEETFAQIQERHASMKRMRDAMQKAKETGDFSEVEALREDLGMPARGEGFGPGEGKFRGMRMHGETGECPFAKAE